MKGGGCIGQGVAALEGKQMLRLESDWGESLVGLEIEQNGGHLLR